MNFFQRIFAWLRGEIVIVVDDITAPINKIIGKLDAHAVAAEAELEKLVDRQSHVAVQAAQAKAVSANLKTLTNPAPITTTAPTAPVSK